MLADQFIDRTNARQRTFFGEGVVGARRVRRSGLPAARAAHVHARPLRGAGATRARGGTYVVHRRAAVLDPRRERALPQLGRRRHRHDRLPEAKLAREAELCYATLALATDYDCWHEADEAVSVEAVVATMRSRTSSCAKEIVNAALPTASPAEREVRLRPARSTAR